MVVKAQRDMWLWFLPSVSRQSCCNSLAVSVPAGHQPNGVLLRASRGVVVAAPTTGLCSARPGKRYWMVFDVKPCSVLDVRCQL